MQEYSHSTVLSSFSFNSGMILGSGIIVMKEAQKSLSKIAFYLSSHAFNGIWISSLKKETVTLSNNRQI